MSSGLLHWLCRCVLYIFKNGCLHTHEQNFLFIGVKVHEFACLNLSWAEAHFHTALENFTRHILTYYTLLLTLCTCKPVQNWFGTLVPPEYAPLTACTQLQFSQSCTTTLHVHNISCSRTFPAHYMYTTTVPPEHAPLTTTLYMRVYTTSVPLEHASLTTCT